MGNAAVSRATSLTALFKDSAARIAAAPMLIFGLWLLTVVLSIPLAAVVGLDVAGQLGASARADAIVDGADYDWMQELNAQSGGVTATLTANVIGFAAVLDNASALLDRRARHPEIWIAITAYFAITTFFAGGAIDRLARRRPLRASGFFSACAGYFPRLVRLAIFSGIFYALLFNPYYNWLFSALLPRLTEGATQERTVFFARVAGYAALVMPLVLTVLIFDYAKVRMVVEDRRSAVGSFAAALRFVFNNPGRVITLFAMNTAVVVIAIAVYAVLAPGIGGGGWSIAGGFLIGQLYIAARGGAKLAFWAAEIAFFQSRLSHAGYVRRPLPTWPESASAEAVRVS